MRYRLDVVAPSVPEVVRFAGGWLVDRVMAGWDVTVLIDTNEDLRPLEILGVDHPALVEPLLLRDVQELEYADIASLLEIPVGTVKSRIHSARQIVQPLLVPR